MLSTKLQRDITKGFCWYQTLWNYMLLLELRIWNYTPFSCKIKTTSLWAAKLNKTEDTKSKYLAQSLTSLSKISLIWCFAWSTLTRKAPNPKVYLNRFQRSKHVCHVLGFLENMSSVSFPVFINLRTGSKSPVKKSPVCSGELEEGWMISRLRNRGINLGFTASGLASGFLPLALVQCPDLWTPQSQRVWVSQR